MVKKVVIGTLVFIGIAISVYYFYLAKPSSFLPSEKVLAELNRYSYDSTVTEVLDVIEIDERRVYVPFITDKNKYGTSLWMWEKHKWELVAESDTGAPKVWKIDTKDPNSYQVFWNIHPEDQISHGEFYFLKDRNYHITANEHTYFPRIQLKSIINFKEKPYGMMKLPKDWRTVMGASIKVEKDRQPDSFFPDFFPVLQDMYFGWIPYNQKHERQDADATMGGGGSATGIDLHYVMYLNEEELEYLDVE
ncbi:hypothetical protein [Ferdinandcohnia sp. Marseille-Q9671]